MVNRQLLSDALQGLRLRNKTLPCKYFYNARGSALFEQICELEEYYQTRTELQIMRRHLDEIVERIGRNITLVEYGSGSSLKTELLLQNIRELKAYIPIDISREFLLETTRQLSLANPNLLIVPVCADYTSAYSLPVILGTEFTRRIAYFPGSTIGNFIPAEAVFFLSHVRQICGPDGGMLIGVDMKKSPAVLHAAYNDALGVTANFNLNLLARLNDEAKGEFDPAGFLHLAFYNERQSRIEMHLQSLSAQKVALNGQCVKFSAGETITTEFSYKYAQEDFRRVAGLAGWRVQQVWTDDENLFSVQFLVPR